MKKLLWVVVLLIAGWIGWDFYSQSQISKHPDANPPKTTIKPDRKIVYWYDPMKPDQHFDKPGKSPFMDMDLVPKYEDEQANNNADLQTVRFKQAFNVRLGKVQVDERGRVWVPNEALLFTGKKVFLFLAEGNGYFNPVEVQTGETKTSMTEITNNINTQQAIVLSAAFLIDAESSVDSELAYIKGREEHRD